MTENVCVSQSDIVKITDSLSREKYLSIDTETFGLRRGDNLFSIIISSPMTNYYFNFLPSAGNCLFDKGLELLRDLLSTKSILWFLHNAKYDLQKLRIKSLEISGNVHFCEAMERLIKNNEILMGLDACLKRRGMGGKDDAVKEYVKKNKLYEMVLIPGKKRQEKVMHYDQVPFELMFPYACRDGEKTLELGLDQRKTLTTGKLADLNKLYTNEMALTKVCFAMEEVGVMLDEDYTRKALRYEQDLITKGKEDFRNATGEDFKDSSLLFSKLFDAEGTKYPRTKKGNPSFKGAFLEECSTPVAKLINTIRKHEKRSGTYYSSFLYYAEQGVVHAQMNQGKTVTGRFSYSDPNLQNVPKEDDDADLKLPFQVRGCFIPREDFIFHAIDYDQQEYRVMIDYAGEMGIISDILGGADVHQAIADMVGIPRKLAKTLSFAILYGAGAEKIAFMLGITIKEANALRTKYLAKLPKVQQLIEGIRNIGSQRGHIFNFMERRFHIDYRSEAYKLPNHLIQGTCADVMKLAMVEIFAYLEPFKSRMVLQVHDELLFEIHKTELDIIQNIIQIMERIYTSRNGMILTASVEHSTKSFSYKDKKAGVYENSKRSA